MAKIQKRNDVSVCVALCFFCQEAKNEIVLFNPRGNTVVPQRATFDHEPCDACAALMHRGIICISVRDGAHGADPYRTGSWCVVTDDALFRTLKAPDLVAHIKRARVAFVPDTVWDCIGLPRHEIAEVLA